jgi:indolepyruvate ferredoxin oxidoreductase alpha subunit
MLSSSRIEPLLRGLGVDPHHLHVLQAHPRQVDVIADVMRKELDHRGLSVIVGVRECLETAKTKKQKAPELATV